MSYDYETPQNTFSLSKVLLDRRYTQNNSVATFYPGIHIDLAPKWSSSRLPIWPPLQHSIWALFTFTDNTWTLTSQTLDT